MQSLIALTEYDIFAYLMVGLALLGLSDLIIGTGFLLRSEWNAGIVTMTVIIAYVSGQITSWPAEIAIENGLINYALKPQTHHLVPNLKADQPDECTPGKTG